MDWHTQVTPGSKGTKGPDGKIIPMPSTNTGYSGTYDHDKPNQSGAGGKKSE